MRFWGQSPAAPETTGQRVLAASEQPGVRLGHGEDSGPDADAEGLGLISHRSHGMQYCLSLRLRCHYFLQGPTQ